MITFGKPDIQQPEIDEVVDTLKSGWIGTGPKTRRFEEMFAEYKGVKEALALNSCTSALHLALEDLELYPHDEVIVPTMTFSATAQAVLYTGAKLVLADCDSTGNICINDLWKRITDKTRAIVVVHYAGKPVEMNSILQLAEKYNLKVIEDAAHAAEGFYKDQPTGTIGDYGCFSFYATKNMTTAEGGMLISKQPLDRIRIRSLHGQTIPAHQRREFKHYLITELGYKYNMTDIQASLGMHQLKRLEENWKKRQEIWDRYQEAFRGLEIPIGVEEGSRHSYHLYTIRVENRKDFIQKLAQEDVGAGVHYRALHLQPFYRRMGFKKDEFPNATRISYKTVSLPLSAGMTDDEVNQVIYAVKKALR